MFVQNKTQSTQRLPTPFDREYVLQNRFPSSLKLFVTSVTIRTKSKKNWKNDILKIERMIGENKITPKQLIDYKTEQKSNK